MIPGPRLDWFADDVLARLAAHPYTVSARSNRIGVRLDGDPLPRAVPGDLPGDLSGDLSGELPSEGLVLGAVQVPSSGRPLVFLNDHPTTGGYPVVGVVVPEDLAVCAQLRPGTGVRFAV
jgi:allophanate hydrolase subunit 2